MAILDDPRHFVLLAGASMVLALGLAVHLRGRPSRTACSFSSMSLCIADRRARRPWL
jgi:hypothetical protein